MQLSQGNTIQIQHIDWLAAQAGHKTCTSRYGDRTKDFIPGQVYEFKNNDTGEVLPIEVTELKVKELNDVNADEAAAIGQYTVADHVIDFYSIYYGKLGRIVTGQTLLTLVHFKVVR